MIYFYFRASRAATLNRGSVAHLQLAAGAVRLNHRGVLQLVNHGCADIGQVFLPQGVTLRQFGFRQARSFCFMTMTCTASACSSSRIAISIFATAYALCGFSAAYAWDIMWLDCMMLAPLVVLGLEQLIKEKKVLLYYISLSLCIISNYYIAIMVCIFQVIWFVITWLENKAVPGERSA